MIHKFVKADSLKQCDKEFLIQYIQQLFEEIGLLANCNQDLQDVLEKERSFHKDYVRYARNTNIIQEMEDYVKQHDPKIIVSEEFVNESDI